MTRQSSAHLTPDRWRAIESTLERLLALPPEHRADFLDRACAGDADLRREVESLIAADPTTGFLEIPVLPELSPAATGDERPAPHELRHSNGGGAMAAVVGAIPSEMAQRLSVALQERYTVERELGRGGMATVYLARDLRHRRSVAIKVLYPELSAVLGPDRFVKEIELTASLQHPHILPLYESGNAGGLLFYVMPSVDGETLRARLTRERHLPIADALRIAREVADALSYAHARGIVHRDVKPENILLQGDHALVADFGIALAVEHASGERMTRTGLSPGTPQYMAPEQAMGDRVIDARADVYALGAVTYEMLAGEAPFSGPSAQAVLAKVLTETVPPLSARRPNVPAHVAAAVHWAMERIPADRVATAAAFASALTDPALTKERVTPPAVAAPPHPRDFTLTRRTATLWGAVALTAVGAALGIGWLRGRANVLVPPSIGAQVAPVRFAIDVDSLVRRVESPALSPDGRTVVYVGTSPQGSLLFARNLDDISGHPVKLTEDAERPFFSADGKSVGYFARDAIWRVKAEGSKPELVSRLAAGDRFTGASWGDDDAIVFSVAGRGLFRANGGGKAPTPVWVGANGEEVAHPQLLPGARDALVTIVRDDHSGKVGVIELATGRLRVLTNGAGARYSKGYVVFVRPDGALFRQPFDLATLQLTGTEDRIERALDATNVPITALGTLFDVAPNGTIAFRSSTAGGEDQGTRLVLTDRAGNERQVITARRPWSPRLSPDGTRIAYGAFASGRNTSDVWITDLRTGTTQRLTDDDRDSNDPRWSPDGKTIAFSAAMRDGKNLFTQTIGSNYARELTRNDGSEWPTAWTPNGDGILFTQWGSNDSRDIWLQPANGAPARPLVASDAQETSGALSPDGRWLLYQSDESGRAEIYLDAYPNGGHRLLVSNGNAGSAVNPMWRADGRELFYWNESDNQLFAVGVAEVRGADTITLSPPLPLFRAQYTPGEMPMYDVSADGTRFVIVANAPRAGRLVVSTGMLAGGARWP